MHERLLLVGLLTIPLFLGEFGVFWFRPQWLARLAFLRTGKVTVAWTAALKQILHGDRLGPFDSRIDPTRMPWPEGFALQAAGEFRFGPGTSKQPLILHRYELRRRRMLGVSTVDVAAGEAGVELRTRYYPVPSVGMLAIVIGFPMIFIPEAPWAVLVMSPLLLVNIGFGFWRARNHAREALAQLDAHLSAWQPDSG